MEKFVTITTTIPHFHHTQNLYPQKTVAMTIAANPYPLALSQDQNFLVRSRNCSIICARTNRKNKSGAQLLTSESNSELKIWSLRIGGVASFSRRHLPLRRSRSPSLWIRQMSHTDSPSTAAQDPPKTVRCVIKGRVQGVFYRKWTMENAGELGLKGWVRNRRDGSVEALFSGKTESVDEMQERCRRGPLDAMVTGFQAFPCNDDPGTRFELKPTV